MAVDSLKGGLDTARLSATLPDQLVRAQREAAALGYLTRRDADDVAVILGLIPEPCQCCGSAIEDPARSQGYCRARWCQLRRAEAAQAEAAEAREAAGS